MLAEPRRRGRAGRLFAFLLLAVVLWGGSAVAGGYVALNLSGAPALTSNGVQTGTGTAAGTGTGTNVALSQIAAKVLPSVVSISAGQSIGSGVIMTADGAVLTNNHVIAGNRGNTVTVTFSNGQRSNATIIGRDPASDLAVIRVNGASGLPPLPFGDSSKLRVGDGVLAVGSPLGLQGSVTSGIVSALNRTIETEGSPAIEGAIQTDAAINPGNSGGALINWSGQLVGINTAIASTGEQGGNIGLGFAISSNTAKQVAERLLRG
jgi:putative serine protease PepD